MGKGGFSSNVETFDDVSLEPCTIDHVHHEIHDGNRFIATDYAAIIAARYCGIKTGPIQCHLVAKVNTDNVCIFSILEASTFGALGANMPFHNRNRASSVTCGATASAGATVTVDGTVLQAAVIGAPRGFGALRNEDEFILAPNTQYFIKMDPSIAAGAAHVSVSFDIYEE